MANSARIQSIFFPPKKHSFDRQTIVGAFDDGIDRELFGYFTDEISFTENELIGLTHEEAQYLRTRKDVAYLQS
jgi:hypothetical protein